MYNIKQGEYTSIYAENLIFTRLTSNGCYVECPRAQAQGFVHNGQVYSIEGTEGYDGKPFASVTEFDGGTALTVLMGAVDDLVVDALMGGKQNV